jgi:hypothetical protein
MRYNFIDTNIPTEVDYTPVPKMYYSSLEEDGTTLLY